MKLFLKIISIAVCVVILSVTLCSCQYLEDKKDEHAVYLDDSKEAFTFRGYTYKRADIDSELSVLFDYGMDTAYVTKDDVPVLLADNFGEELYYRANEKNPVIMECWSIYGDAYYAYPTGMSANMLNLRTSYFEDEISARDRFYIREDRYDEVCETIKNAVLDEYYIWITDYRSFDHSDDYDYYDYDDPRKLEIIDEKYTKAIKGSLKDGKKISYTDFEKDELNAIGFGICDKDAIITNNYGVHLLQDENDYYLVQLDDGFAISNDLVKVPDKYKDDIIELYRKYYEEEFGLYLSDIFYDYNSKNEEYTE